LVESIEKELFSAEHALIFRQNAMDEFDRSRNVLATLFSLVDHGVKNLKRFFCARFHTNQKVIGEPVCELLVVLP